MQNDRAKKRRLAPLHALVVDVRRVDGMKGDVWAGKHVARVSLTCGHTIRRVLIRRLLVGERIRCPECERHRINQPLLAGIYPSVAE